MILNHRVGRGAEDTVDLGRLTYLLDSGSDRIGALDFQRSPVDHVPRDRGEAGLAELNRLAESARKVEDGEPLSAALDDAPPAWKLRRRRPAKGPAPRRVPAPDRQVQLEHRQIRGGQGRVRRDGTCPRAGIDAARVQLTHTLCELFARITFNNPHRQVAGCLERPRTYRLSETEARAIVDHQIEVIESQWEEVCDLAGMTPMTPR